MIRFPPQLPSRVPSGARVAICMLHALLAAVSAAGQIRGLAIEGGTVVTGDGETIERGTVLVQGSRITAVGQDLEVSLLARRVSAAGKFVTPGLIDAYGTTALRYATTGDQATAKASDAFDRYATDEIRAALREGVTTVYVPARCGDGIGGLGAVVRLQTGSDASPLILSDEAALSAAIDADGRRGPLARVKSVTALRKRFEAARDYRTAWEDYAEELAEYEKQLAERTETVEKNAEKPRSKENGGNKSAASSALKRRRREKPADQGEKRADKKDAEKGKRKKPAEPARDRNAEMLLRVLDGELRLRVEAHHPADILNVLELAEDFKLALVLEGATGAHRVADQLAELAVPVVLWPEPTPVRFVPDHRRRARPDAASILQGAGVDVYFGSGVLAAPTSTPGLALRVSRAVGGGFDEDAGLRAITSGAARLLGVGGKIGRLRPGLEADLVIWDDHPFAPGARVERVFVAGREVYSADNEPEGHEE